MTRSRPRLSTDVLINKLAAQDPSVKWLISVPGIGRFLSLLIRWKQTISTLPRSKAFCELCRVGTFDLRIQFTTCAWALNQAGNKWLRWAFIEAVTPAVRSSQFLRDH
jgi:hypothetical protein